jgi:hypothetical protein
MLNRKAAARDSRFSGVGWAAGMSSVVLQVLGRGGGFGGETKIYFAGWSLYGAN